MAPAVFQAYSRPEALCAPAVAGIGEVQEEREREAEGQRDRQHGREAEGEAGGLVRRERDGQHGEGGEVGDRQLADRPLAGEHGEACSHEEDAHGPGGPDDAATHPPVDRRAERDAEQHGEQHDVEGVHRRADDQGVRARPEHLDAERGRAGGEGESGAEGRAGPRRGGGAGPSLVERCLAGGIGPISIAQRRATPPTKRLVAAATTSVPRTPRAGTRTNGASATPSAPPRVLRR